MGPLAHVEFERHLIEASFLRGARSDRDHPVWVLINAADIPDRTSSLAGCATSCVSSLVSYGNRLCDAGAHFMVVPCNTAHAFYDEVQTRLRIPWLNLVELVSASILRCTPTAKRVGLLATDGTLKSRIYRNSLLRVGLEPVEPPLGSTMQQQLMGAIYSTSWGIKATGLQGLSRARAVVDNGISWLKDEGADVVIGGCTEFSIILRSAPEPTLPWIDPLAVLAESVLDTAFAPEGVGAGSS
jgi:aspartate racemase